MNNLKITFFKENGYVVFKNIIPLNNIKILRDQCDKIPDFWNGRAIPGSLFLSIPEVRVIPFDKNIVASIRQLLGESLTIYPNFTVRRSANVPWHTDTAFGFTQLGWEGTKTLYIQCSVFLQDNKDGGGLDVVPGSHYSDFGFTENGPLDVNVLRSLVSQSRTIATEPGDLLLWDARLIHRSTVSTKPDNIRYGIQWTASRGLSNDGQFLRLLASRAHRSVENNTNLGTDERYAEISEIIYPTSYSTDVVQLVEQGQLAMASLVQTDYSY